MWATSIVENKEGKQLVKLEIFTEKTSQGMILDIEDALMVGSGLIETVNEIDPELAKEAVENIQFED